MLSSILPTNTIKRLMSIRCQHSQSVTLSSTFLNVRSCPSHLVSSLVDLLQDEMAWKGERCGNSTLFVQHTTWKCCANNEPRLDSRHSSKWENSGIRVCTGVTLWRVHIIHLKINTQYR